MKKTMLLYLSQEDIISLRLSSEQIVDAVAAVLRSHGKRLVQMPPKPAIFPRKGRYSYFHAMPAYVEDLDICGLKWLGRASHNPGTHDLPQFTGLQVVNDPETGVPLAVMDCRWITAARTAALSVVTAQCCAPPEPRSLGIVGAGLQGRFHALMMTAFFPTMDTIYLNDRSSEVMGQYVADMAPRLKTKIVPGSIEEVARQSDVLVSAGVRELTYRLDWISPGTLCIGLDLASAWHPEVIEGVDRIFVDDSKQFWDRYGTEPEAFSAKPEVTGEISKVLIGDLAGRTDPKERILSLNVGMAICDLALGDLIFREARRQNAGLELPLMEREDILL